MLSATPLPYFFWLLITFLWLLRINQRFTHTYPDGIFFNNPPAFPETTLNQLQPLCYNQNINSLKDQVDVWQLFALIQT